MTAPGEMKGRMSVDEFLDLSIIQIGAYLEYYSEQAEEYEERKVGKQKKNMFVTNDATSVFEEARRQALELKNAT